MIASRTELEYRSFPLILAAPSGAGKTTIAHALADHRNDIDFSISCTTRPPRSGEEDGVDYHFRSPAEFRQMVDAGELLEWAEVHGSLYGTPRSNLVEARARRHLLLLDIDVQGSRQVKQSVPDAVSIFILPPSSAELARRLEGRGSEDVEVRRRRLLAAREELRSASQFDYVIINDDLPAAVELVDRIVDSEVRRTVRSTDLDARISRLVEGIDRAVEKNDN